MAHPRSSAVHPTDIVIGAGVVGLACAFWLANTGRPVTVVDRDPAGDKASFGNAGAVAVPEVVPASQPGLVWRIPGWLLDPLGPLALRPSHLPGMIPWLLRFLRAGRAEEVARIATLLSSLNLRAQDDMLALLASLDLQGELHQKGALVVYETDAGFERDANEWALRQRHGMRYEVIDGYAARALEPSLGALVRRAVIMPQWSHLSDPKRVVDRLREYLSQRGVAFVASEALAIEAGEQPAVRLADGTRLAGASMIVAAGAWSGRLAASLQDRVLLESERGYNMTFAAPGIDVHRPLVFAERKFVATPLAIGLRIGGAAEFAGLAAPANYERAVALVQSARRYLPGLPAEGGMPWMGQRPSTPDSLPVIGRSPRHKRVFYAFGHGHLGLTQSSTTGRLLAELVADRNPSLDLSPFSIGRFG